MCNRCVMSNSYAFTYIFFLQCLLSVKLNIDKFTLNSKFHEYPTRNCNDIRPEFSK